MPDNKKQHYVPKFYLRFFSQDGKNISLYNLKTKKVHCDVPLSSQCYEDYFYGNIEIEKNNSQLEGKYSEIIKKIISKGKLVLDEQDYGYFLSFLLYQWGRTSEARSDARAQTQLMVEKVMKPMMLKDRTLAEKGVTKKDIEELDITLPTDHSYKMLYCLAGMPLIGDLTPVIVTSSPH